MIAHAERKTNSANGKSKKKAAKKAKTKKKLTKPKKHYKLRSNRQKSGENRKVKRALLREATKSSPLKTIMDNYLPHYHEWTKAVKDPRCLPKIKYDLPIVFLTLITGFTFHAHSMRNMTDILNTEEAIENIYELLGLENKEEIPHWQTILNTLANVSSEEIEKLKELITKTILKCVQPTGMIYIAIDGTRIHQNLKADDVGGVKVSTGEYYQHPNMIHNKGTDHEKMSVYDYVVECKIIISTDFKLSIASHFLYNLSFGEGDSEEKRKQECEMTAAKMLIPKIRKVLPKRNICLVGDALYVAAPFMQLCIDNKMHFIARYKEGSASNIQKYVDANAHHVDAKIEGAPLAKIRYCNEVPHQDLKLNYVEFINFKEFAEDGSLDDVQDFKYVTDLDVNERNALDVILAGRGRWQIEEAFRAQKQNLDLEHIFSYDWDTAINVYNLQQISHALEQLLVYHYEDLANKVAHSILILNFLEGFRTITYSQNVTNSKHTDSTDHQIVVA